MQVVHVIGCFVSVAHVRGGLVLHYMENGANVYNQPSWQAMNANA